MLNKHDNACVVISVYARVAITVPTILISLLFMPVYENKERNKEIEKIERRNTAIVTIENRTFR